VQRVARIAKGWRAQDGGGGGARENVSKKTGAVEAAAVGIYTRNPRRRPLYPKRPRGNRIGRRPFPDADPPSPPLTIRSRRRHNLQATVDI